MAEEAGEAAVPVSSPGGAQAIGTAKPCCGCPLAEAAAVRMPKSSVVDCNTFGMAEAPVETALAEATSVAPVFCEIPLSKHTVNRLNFDCPIAS